MTIVALIPARAGSKRIPGKNTKLLAGQPLIAYTIAAAQQSGIFAQVIVCSDDADVISEAIERRARYRWRDPVPDDQPDIVWVRDVLAQLPDDREMDGPPDAFAILRPTSPFRTAGTIRHAWEVFRDHQPVDSLRAVRFVTEHPAKMWVLTLGSRMVPLLPFHHLADPLVPWHSSPTQSIPIPRPVVQTGALEIAWTRTVIEQQSISGSSVLSYFMPVHEDLDLNTEADWDEAVRLILDENVPLPALPVCP